MARWSKTLTESAERDVSFRFTCLYCGAKNEGVIQEKASRSKEFQFTNSGASEAQREMALWQFQTQLELQEELDRRVGNYKKTTERIGTYWQNCHSGENTEKTDSLFTLKFRSAYKCQSCGEIQPYSKEYRSALKSAGILLFALGLGIIFAGIASFGVSFTRGDPEEAKVFRIVGIILMALSAAMIPASVIFLKKESTKELKEYCDEMRSLPFEPEKLPVFEMCAANDAGETGKDGETVSKQPDEYNQPIQKWLKDSDKEK